MSYNLTDRFDLLVVGGGAAGLWTALTAAKSNAKVGVVARSPLSQSASYWAQGGLAAALTDSDSPDLHLRDTLRAGRKASKRSAAEILVGNSARIVEELLELSVDFDRNRDGQLALGLEGGHSQRRIVHAGGSSTGRHITARLTKLVERSSQIQTFEGVEAEALWVYQGRCIGVQSGELALVARATVLATGGGAALWERSTNPPSATGSGLALAYEAGAKLADLEFVQFHPTALKRDGGGKYDGFLITEAVRGEGAKLVTSKGERFVDELAPRDEVARAIIAEVEGGGDVYLDMRSIESGRFPNIYEVLAEVGIDPASQRVPVFPAAHYMMGGVATDSEGRTNIASLYAVGECSCTGLHGANRLASNSLSECFVFGARAARAVADEPPLPSELPTPPTYVPPRAISPSGRKALWQHCGLERAGTSLKQIADEPSPLPRLIAMSALKRTESRGAHYRNDYPDTDSSLDYHHIVLDKSNEASVEEWL